MKHACVNCRVTVFRGVLCVDCVRMIVATVVGELLVVGILGAIAWWRG